MNKFVIMNKDVPLRYFWFVNEGTMFERICADNDLSAATVNSWIAGRTASKHRNHINKLLRDLGCDTKSAFCRLTKCLSLNDTLWVKVVGDESKWENVSLYKNHFSEIIANAAFHEYDLPEGIGLSCTSPEWTTGGQFGKCWRRSDDKIELIKCGSSNGIDLSVYAEYLASQVFTKLDGRSVSYGIELVGDRIATVCELFTNEAIGFRPYVDFLKPGESTDIETIRSTYAAYGYDDLFAAMIIGDCITYNVDRHLSNFGWYVLNEDLSRRTMAPIFDYNLCFFPFELHDDKLEECIYNNFPRIGIDWVNPAKYLITDKLRAELINLKDLWLDCPLSDQMSKERLFTINKLKNDQIDRILGIKSV